MTTSQCLRDQTIGANKMGFGYSAKSIELSAMKGDI